MHRVAFIHKSKLHAGGEDDQRWTPMLAQFEDVEAANDEMGWLAIEDDGFAYRVEPVPANEVRG